MATIDNLTVHAQDNEHAYVTLTEDGTEVRTEAMPYAEANELATCIAHRHNVCVQYLDKDGRGTAVMVPEDFRYVAPWQAIYLVQHTTYDYLCAAFSKTEAFRICADEVRDAREAEADADGYYVTHETCQTLDVPDAVRMLGRDAVLAYVHGG